VPTKWRVFSVKTSLYVVTTRLQRLNATYINATQKNKDKYSYKTLLRVTCDFVALKRPAALQSHNHYTENRTGYKKNQRWYLILSYCIVLAKWACVFIFFKPITLQLQHFTGSQCSTLGLYKLRAWRNVMPNTAITIFRLSELRQLPCHSLPPRMDSINA
jgi:hypothetical protein